MSKKRNNQSAGGVSSPSAWQAPQLGGWGAEIKDYVLIAIGTFLYALGVTVFFLPYELTTGGVAGIGSIIYYSTGIEVQVTFITINVILLIAAVRVLGIRFCIKTIYSVIVMTILLWLLQRLIEVPNPDAQGEMMLPRMIGDESFMACVLGAICCGVGLTLCFENNGSTGGTDIIAAIVNKYKNMSLGTVIMACDCVIISSCYFVFHDWARVICGFVIMFVVSVTLDYCIRRQHQSVQFMIFSRNYQRIADAINQMHHGATILEGEGWFTRSERKVIVSIVRKSESKMMLRAIKQIDPYAFVSMNETHSVYGEAFDDVMKISTAKGEKIRHIVVVATDDEPAVAKAQEWLGDDFDVRSLSGVGCYTSQPINVVMLGGESALKASHVKKFYGFDCIVEDPDGTFTVVEGPHEAYVTHEHVRKEQLAELLNPRKQGKNGKK